MRRVGATGLEEQYVEIPSMAAVSDGAGGDHPGDRCVRRADRAPQTATSSGSPGDACGTAPVALSVWGGFPEMDPVYQAAGAAYKALHPNVDVSTFSTDLRGFEQKLTTALPTGTAGDIIVYGADWLSRFIDQDLFAEMPADLDAFIKSGAFDPAIVADTTYKDRLWGVPEFVGWAALYYNTDMLAEAGLTGPPTSMDQIVDYATQARPSSTKRATWSGPASASG